MEHRHPGTSKVFAENISLKLMMLKNFDNGCEQGYQTFFESIASKGYDDYDDYDGDDGDYDHDENLFINMTHS